MGLKDLILEANDLPSEVVDVPEWSTTVQVRGLSATEREAFDASICSPEGDRNLDNWRARLLVRTIVDENGERVFQDGDAAALGGKSTLAIDRLFLVAQRLSGLGAAAKEDAIKNSGAAPSGDSSSGSA